MKGDQYFLDSVVDTSVKACFQKCTFRAGSTTLLDALSSSHVAPSLATAGQWLVYVKFQSSLIIYWFGLVWFGLATAGQWFVNAKFQSSHLDLVWFGLASSGQWFHHVKFHSSYLGLIWFGLFWLLQNDGLSMWNIKLPIFFRPIGRRVI